MSVESKPAVAITMGDAAGVGPELCVRALHDARVRECCIPVVFGDPGVLRHAAEVCGVSLTAQVVPLEAWEGGIGFAGAMVVACSALDADPFRPGVPQAACGTAAVRAIEAAVRAALAGRVAAVATAPIHKGALKLAGIPHPGHTELLAELTGTRRYCMMMASDELMVSLVTIHVGLREVAGLLTREEILKTIELTHEAVVRLGRATPRLAVCALNPHGGEQGIFGSEERELIEPAIAQARGQGMIVEGPVVPDTAFLPDRRERVDAYVVMYHDQGLIPFKMLAFEHGVNLTLGLPIVRTSVDHGTAFDIAWQGRASTGSMVASIRWAVRLAGRRAAAS